MPIPELRTFLNRFRIRLAAAAPRRGRGGSRGVSGLRPGIRGSVLVQALIAGLIAVIGALLLASRLFSSRVSSLSRSENLAAREAAEYGLNDLQAQLNTNQRSYLWVTRRDRWSSVDLASLNACQVSVQDASGNPATSLPALPAGITSAKTISSVGGTTISYQLTAFEPPRLPDNETTTTAQAAFCSNATAAANFGNLNGGSALITVQGTVSRGGSSSSFSLTRRSHVASTSTQPAFSFMILGDAYKDNATGETFGASTDIANLRYLDGNICYGAITSTTCFTTPALPKTIIGCRDLGSCLINNVFNNNQKDKLSKYCADVKAKKKKKKGFTCNEFQQSPEAPDDLPPVPTPLSEGFLSYAGYPTGWDNYSSAISCSIQEDGTNDFANCFGSTKLGITIASSKSTKSYFPYQSSIPSSLTLARLRANQNLVPGCYFNNTNGSPTALGASNGGATAINCLASSLAITGSGKNDPNLIVYTTAGVGSTTKLLPVNIFLHGAGTTTITLNDGGIENSDRNDLGWSRLRLIGREVSTAAGSAVSCSQSTDLTSTKENDLNNLFIWLPNSSLTYSRVASKDNAYLVVWVCQFTGPTKDTKGNPYSIITPLPESVVRAGLASSLGSSFIQSSAASYRGYGSQDSPTQ